VSFSQPGALWLLAIAVPLVLIYALRGNPRQRPTTAAFLWRGLEQRLTAHRRWQRLPRSLALLLQLLALGAGTVALAGPVVSGRPFRQVVFVIDASPSMQASDPAPSRFDAARTEIGQRLAELADDDRVSLVRMGQRAEVLASGRRADVERALVQARPGSARPDLREALTRAAELMQTPAGEGSELVVFTDGTIGEPTGLPPLTVPVRFVRFGTRGNNQGISALSVRHPPGGGGNGLGGFARVTNYADQAIRLPVQIGVDGSTIATRLVELPARGRAELPFDVPSTARVVSLSLAGRDDLALDDRADIAISENRRRAALVVSPTPGPWEQALGALPSVTVNTQAPTSFHDSGADLVVLDGFVPAQLPGGQLLVVNPPPGNPLVSVLGEAREVIPNTFDARHPLLRSLDPGSLRLSRALRISPPGWASTVIGSQTGPLILAGEVDGRRIVVLGFDPFASQLEKLVTFPLLVANAVEYLNAGGLEPFVEPEQSVTLPVAAEAGEVSLAKPDGSREILPVRDGAVRLESTELTGRYVVRQQLPAGQQVTRSFAVNLFGEAEADTTPRDLTTIPADPSASSAAAPLSAAPWQPFALVVLGLLSVEWLYFVRRG
jgi:von Willebrand factor type A domain/Aerotolerance regulator N-terminal